MIEWWTVPNLHSVCTALRLLGDRRLGGDSAEREDQVVAAAGGRAGAAVGPGDAHPGRLLCGGDIRRWLHRLQAGGGRQRLLPHQGRPRHVLPRWRWNWRRGALPAPPHTLCFEPHNLNAIQTLVATLSKGQFFGEMALLTSKPRHATVIAKGALRVQAIDRDTFVRLFGPMEDILKRNSG